MEQCTEGGEHIHQPQGTIVEQRPSCPRWKCPVGLVECLKHDYLRLALWRQGWQVPKLWRNDEEKEQILVSTLPLSQLQGFA